MEELTEKLKHMPKSYNINAKQQNTDVKPSESRFTTESLTLYKISHAFWVRVDMSATIFGCSRLHNTCSQIKVIIKQQVFKPCMKAPYQRRRVDVFVDGIGYGL